VYCLAFSRAKSWFLHGFIKKSQKTRRIQIWLWRENERENFQIKVLA